MTDEEKIREILNCERCKKIVALAGVKCNSPCDRFKDLMEMAAWKEQQMIKCLEEHTHDYDDGDTEFAVCDWKKQEDFIEDFKKAVEE